MGSPSDKLRATVSGTVRRLVVVLGDQLDVSSEALSDFDDRNDAVLMMEVEEESTHVPSHRQRVTLFLSAMRHFALELQRAGRRVRYIKLDEPRNTGTFAGELARAVKVLKPQAVRVVRPGEHRVLEAIRAWGQKAEVDLDIVGDGHFFTTPEDFASWAEGRKQLIMEYFYREQRKRLDVLMTRDGKPRGGSWNYDRDNREAFKATPRLPEPCRFGPDGVTREVMTLVDRRFPNAPGKLDGFVWPVSKQEAQRALEDFVERRLAKFGPHQDAMWTDQPFLYHSLLSPTLNLKLLDPRDAVRAAIDAYEAGDAPIESVEGFVRQIIGWREFIRGVYWYEGKEYGRRNNLEQHGKLPSFYWTGETEMKCMAQSVGQVLDHGYGHHIQRLMVTGNFALTAGIAPRAISDWYLGMYVDAVDWVTLPNTLGMVMHADGGVVGTKPYAASGRYVQRMSNYCEGCRYDPGERTGDDACPFTTFYWDFLIRNRKRFERNNRMKLVLKNVERMNAGERSAVAARANRLREQMEIGSVESE